MTGSVRPNAPRGGPVVPGRAKRRPRPTPWQPRTLTARASVLVLHLAPGLLAYVLLRVAREPLQHTLGITSAEAQIGLIMTGIMLLLGAATFVSARLLDGLRPREVLRLTGVARFDPAAAGVAVALWLGVVAASSLVAYEDTLRSLIERVDWLALPPWHFQRTDGFIELAPAAAGFALVANVVCEELWFRGYLQDKLAFMGSASWIGAGLLFTLYHVFEAPIAYPGVLGALALAGLWALRQDLWSCVLLHALLNAPV